MAEDICPKSKREDGGHAWAFDGDDPYVKCFWCGRLQDAITGRVIRATAPAIDTEPFVPNLVTVPNVEIIEVGEDWETSTGTFTWDEDDLVSAIESQSDPAIRTPILKLGHTDPRLGFDGEPAFGRLENMRLTNNDQTLVCDLVGVPQWLATIMWSAYPRRSFEGEMNVTTRTGNTWSMVVTALSLLGTAYPAINTLEDLKSLWGSTPPVLLANGETAEPIAASDGNKLYAKRVDDVKWKRSGGGGSGNVASAGGGGGGAESITIIPNVHPNVQATEPNDEQPPQEVNSAMPKPKSKSGGAVRASTSLDDVRSAFYDSLNSMQMWWWIRQVLVNPLQLVVDDDEGGLWMIDVTVGSDDIVTFAEPEAIKVEYVAAAKANGIAKPSQLVAASFNSADDAGARPRATIPDEDADDSAETPEEEQSEMNLTPEALAALGLAADASEADISAAIIARGQQTPAGDGGTTEPEGDDDSGDEGTSSTGQLQVPEGMALVDSEQWSEVQQEIAASRARREADATAERDRLITASVLAGKFPRSRVEHYTNLYKVDPEGTKQILSSLSPGLIPVAERGIASGSESGSDTGANAYPESWKRTVTATNGRVRVSNRVKVGND